MLSVHDVAAYIIKEHGEIGTARLARLLYYSQGWHLAWEGKRLFPQSIEAWMNGPVIREIGASTEDYLKTADSWPKGDPELLNEDERETVNIVLSGRYYGEMSNWELKCLARQELPWRRTRESGEPTAREGDVISPWLMQRFFQALDREVDPEDAINYAPRRGRISPLAGPQPH